jgi:hypothetical protein
VHEIGGGLYYFNARWYDSSTGRFTSEDPVGDGVNWYAYVANNPLLFIDSSGLEHHENITVTVYRSVYSILSRVQDAFPERTFTGLDVTVFRNTDSGDTFVMTGGQSVANSEDYPVGNTVRGDFTMVYDDPADTIYWGASFVIANTRTWGGTEVGSEGRIRGTRDTPRWRMHSNYFRDRTTGRWFPVPMQSGGCVMHPFEEMEGLAEWLTDQGVLYEDTFAGSVMDVFDPDEYVPEPEMPDEETMTEPSPASTIPEYDIPEFYE